MNKRLSIGLYLVAWAAALASVVFGLMRAGAPFWLSVLLAYFLFIGLNGTLAYRHRVRQLAREGRRPPSYFKYLLTGGQGFKREVRVPPLVRLVLALIAAIGGTLFLLLALALTYKLVSSEVRDRLAGLAALVVTALLGAGFLYVGVRLFVVKAGEPLFKALGRSRSDGA